MLILRSFVNQAAGLSSSPLLAADAAANFLHFSLSFAIMSLSAILYVPFSAFFSVSVFFEFSVIVISFRFSFSVSGLLCLP